MPSATVSAEVTDQQVERLLLRSVAAVVAVVLAGGLVALQSLWNARSRVDDQGIPSVTASSWEVGPRAGTLLADYVPARAHVLAGATGTRAAVVSFTTYVGAAEARSDVAGVRMAGLLEAEPGDRPAFVEGRWTGTERVVFAVVVVGPVETLRRLATSRVVRLVDVAPGPTVPSPGATRGIRPEETERAGEPVARPVSEGA